MSNFKTDLSLHEDLRKCSLSNYGSTRFLVPSNMKLIEKIDNKKTGFYAQVFKRDSEIIITYKGTNNPLGIDGKNDVAMGIKRNIPAQAYEALDLYDKYAKYSDNIILTGDSLGASCANIVAAIRGAKAVGFNPFGVGDILKKNNISYKEDNIINYCNKADGITSINAQNQIGTIYEMESISKGMGFYDHYLENQKPIEKQQVITPEELKRYDGIEYMKDKSINAIKKVGEETANYSYNRMQNDIKPYQNLLNILEKQSNNSEDLLSQIQNNKLFGGYRVNNGRDEVYVKEYKRSDGRVVKAHWRSYPGDFDPNKRLTDMQEAELGHALDFWMEEEKYIR